MKNVLKNKKMLKDMIINTFASMIPIALLQLFILPKTSIILGDEKYGLLVTYLSIFNIVPATFGNVLNNIRLLNNKDNSKEGNYNFLLLVYEIISSFILLLLILLYVKDFSIINIALMLILGLLWLYREYHIVIFRIELNYIKVLKDNIILSFGYLIGFILFKVIHSWQLIYIIGYVLSILFISLNSNLYKEPLKKTKDFKKITKDSVQLTLSNIISRSIIYADKIIIYPILGGQVVSVYYAASIFSKITNLALSPITSVILSYVAKMKNNKSIIFNLTLLLSTLVLIVGSIVCYLLAEPVLSIIYPQYVDSAIKYVPIILIGMIFATLSQILNPFILKFYKMKWQIIINGITLTFYLILSFVLLHKYNLYGFCFSVLLSNLLKLILIIGLYYFRKEGEKKIR